MFHNQDAAGETASIWNFLQVTGGVVTEDVFYPFLGDTLSSLGMTKISAR